jgi:hypothetical protein
MPDIKARDTLRIHSEHQNCKHNIPRVMLEVIYEFKNLDFVQEVGLGKFLSSSKKSYGRLVGFNDVGKNYLVSVVRQGYEQKFFLRVDSKKEEYEQRISELLTKL